MGDIDAPKGTMSAVGSTPVFHEARPIQVSLKQSADNRMQVHIGAICGVYKQAIIPATCRWSWSVDFKHA
jgi:hypothetical protein